jgi:hypothetical protein
LQSNARLFGVGSQDVLRKLVAAKKQAQGQQAAGHTVDPDEAVSHKMLEIRESLGSGIEHMMQETPLGVPRAPATDAADRGAVERAQGEPFALTRAEYLEREEARTAGKRRPKRTIGGLSHTPGMD